MDMSSFPKMLQFKQKMVPHQQLLRWSEWFSKYDFESYYIKGAKNTLADMLSRQPVKEIHMMASSSSSNEKHYYDFEANMPKDAHELIERKTLHEQLHQKIFQYQSIILSNHGASCHYFSPLGIHPDFPFAQLYRIEDKNMPEEVLCFIWYLCSVYTIGIAFDIQWLYQYVNSQQGQRDNLAVFLTWFAPLTSWSGKLRKAAKATNLSFKRIKGQGSLNPFFNPHSIYFFHRPVQVNYKSKKIHALSTLIHHNDYQKGIRPDFNLHDIKKYEEFQVHAFRLNNARQTFQIPFKPNWSYYPTDYQMSLDEDLQFFMMKQKDMAKMIEEKTIETIDDEQSSSTCPPEYFQDGQIPEEDMDIDDVIKQFDISVSEQKTSSPEEENICPGDYYGCCEKHIIKQEIDH